MNQTIIPKSKMGFGCMRLPLLDAENPKSIDIEHFKKMVDVFMDAGNTYFDTAFVYHEGESEVALNKALVSRYPRETFTLATKCLAWAMPDKESAQGCLDISLERLGTNYIDYFLLHNVGGKRTAKFDEYDMWNFAKEQKAAGKVKFWGFSMHDSADTLEELLTAHPDVDFIQLQVNYLDWDDPHNEAARMMDVAAKHNKPVIIMEPARGGRLCNLPDEVGAILEAAKPGSTQAEWAYRFCWNLPNIISVLSGMSNLEQVEENTQSYLTNQPFSEDEQAALDAAIAKLRSYAAIPCTSCNYCVEGCPAGVKIPTVMELLNLESMTRDHEFVKGLYSWQTAEGRASACTQCGSCEDMCPQQIDIINQLEKAADLYE
jgi:hypothetical protein